MLAAYMYGIHDVRLKETGKPTITDHELLIQVKSAGICGTDLRIIGNGLPGITEQTPIILGHELSGVIAEIGMNVKGYQVGDRVAVAPNMGCGICALCIRGDQHLCANYQALGIQMDGGFAEYVRIPEMAVRSGNVMKIPDHVSFEEAAVNEPLSCVYNGIKQCRIEPGDDVLIIGAGPIGIMYALLAKLSGAARVIINNRSPQRLEIARSIDDSFITLEGSSLKEQIHELTNGRGVNVCVTANPSPEAQAAAVELVGMYGKVNLFGGLPKDKQYVQINTNLIHYKQLMVTGSTKSNNEHFSKTLQFLSSGIIDGKKLISARFPLSQIGNALEYAGSSLGMKTVIIFDE